LAVWVRSCRVLLRENIWLVVYKEECTNIYTSSMLMILHEVLAFKIQCTNI
jgi:hypothetical protein